MLTELAAAVDAECHGRRSALAPAVARLIDLYHAADERVPALTRDIDVLAYAAYRMPATAAATEAALLAAATALPGYAPRSLVDVGGGTGAAMWAATSVWPSLADIEVLERSLPMASWGRRLSRHARSPATRAARWRPVDLTTIDPALDAVPAPPADLATMAYVLGELPAAQRPRAVAVLARAAPVVAVVEPGTPAGYQRVIEARQQLIHAGMSVVAPCPHDDRCPMLGTGDWCHLSVRLPRTALHRQVKGAELAYEDEKFSYVCAARERVVDRCGARIVRHPQKRKGLVALRLCTRDDGLLTSVVSKRQGETYRAARDARWGDRWDAHPAGGG